MQHERGVCLCGGFARVLRNNDARYCDISQKENRKRQRHWIQSITMPSASLSYLRPEVAALKQVLDKFVEEECIPAEKEFEEHIQKRTGAARWTLDAIPPCMERLKSRAKQLGLWNLFIPPHLISKLPDRSLGPSIALNYREYGVLCESMGRSPTIASEACNCGAPDTGNMEVFLEFGTPAQKRDYLIPLLRGKIRSCFLMTEPAVASSDPTNLETKLVPTGPSSFRLDGRKWWSTGAMHPKCRVALVVTKLVGSTSKHQAHTIVAVPMPQASVRCVRPLTVMGYDDAPHGHAEVLLDGVTVTRDDLVGGEGSGFLVSQARLGPGRIHHCMRAIGMGTCQLGLHCRMVLTCCSLPSIRDDDQA